MFTRYETPIDQFSDKKLLPGIESFVIEVRGDFSLRAERSPAAAPPASGRN